MDGIFEPRIVPTLQTIAIHKLVQFSYQQEIIIARRDAKSLRRLCSNMKRYIILVLTPGKEIHLKQSKPRNFIDRNRITNESLSTSSQIQITLQDNLDSLTDSIKEWLDYHMSGLAFFRTRIQRIYFLRRFERFEFNLDGTIDYRRTARNILTCNKFSGVDKYAIACVYNLEEQIEQLWPQASKNVGTEVIQFDMYPLQFYWTCLKTDQMENIPPIDGSRELRMIRQRYVNREWEMEYFWNRLSHLHKKQSLIAFFQIRDGYKMKFCAKFLCSEQDGELIEQIVTEAGPDIMTELVIVSFVSKFALPVWSRIKNMFSERQFITLYKRIFRRLNTVFDRDVRIDIEQRLCIEIWNEAPDILKNYARNYFEQNNSLDRLRNLVDR